jgi:hypothetical protein
MRLMAFKLLGSDDHLLRVESTRMTAIDAISPSGPETANNRFAPRLNEPNGLILRHVA